MDDILIKNYQESKKNKISDNINTENSKKSKYIKTYSSFEENTINEEHLDTFNNYYDNENKIINNNEEEGEDNDLSSDDEYDDKLKNIKIGILKVKLNILIKIIIAKIQKYYFYFISKTRLKIKSNEIFIKGDNFLYNKLKLKTSEANKFYALKKLVYVIRKNTYNKLIKQHYFYQWKNRIYQDKYLIKNEENSKITNAITLCSILTRIYNRRLEKNYYLKYYLKKWKYIKIEKEIYKNKIKKGMIILSSLFNRKIRKVFKIFPRNYLNLKYKSKIFKNFNNNSQINYIIGDDEKYIQRGLQDFYDYKKKYKNLLKQNKLLKIIEKLEIKNRVNKNIYLFFHLLKNSTKTAQFKKEIKNINNSLSDLKYDSMLNAIIMIKIILNEHIQSNLFNTKKIFFDKLNYTYKFQMIKSNYKEIMKTEEKNGIKNIRLKYQRIFALQKILIINQNHKFFYSDLTIQLKVPLLLKYFNLWKKYTFNFAINHQIKKLAAQKIFIIIQIFINRLKQKTFHLLRKESIQIFFKSKKYHYFSFFIYLLLKQHILKFISKNIFSILKRIRIMKNEMIIKQKDKIIYLKKIYFTYKKCISIKKYNYLIKWYFICLSMKKNKKLFQEKMKILLNKFDKTNSKNLLKKIFNKWEQKIEQYQINDKKRQIQISFYLHKFIRMKTLTSLWFHFKKWSSNITNLTNSQNYENLLMEIEKIKKENDNLIVIYYKKRQEYAKTLYDYNYMKKFYCDNCINEKEDEINYMSLKSNDIKEAGKLGDSLIISQNKIDNGKDISKNLQKSVDNDASKSKSFPFSFDENNFIVNEENKIQANNNSIINLSEDDNINNYLGKKVDQCPGENIQNKNFSDDEENIINDNLEDEKNDINDINNDDNINDYINEYEEQKKYYENYINILLEKKNELIQMKNMLISQKLNESKSEKSN